MSAVTLDQNLLDVIEQGIHAIEGSEDGDSTDTAYQIRKRMVLEHGLFLCGRDGWVPLDRANRGYVNGVYVYISRLGAWCSSMGRVDVEGKALTFDREGTIILRTL